ncbi:MAG: hypothetical protein EU535_08795 [Promethearchaeota archaeon]|nr:MAG: hypothetical protein EU535_08795 [Candidatus Lokiarchaeota archaeon]
MIENYRRVESMIVKYRIWSRLRPHRNRLPSLKISPPIQNMFRFQGKYLPFSLPTISRNQMDFTEG